MSARSLASSSFARASVLAKNMLTRVASVCLGEEGQAYLLYIYHPVKIPTDTEITMLQILTTLEAVLICSFSPERIRSLLPMKVGTNSLGVIIAVASPYISGCTVGNVETAPLQIE